MSEQMAESTLAFWLRANAIFSLASGAAAVAAAGVLPGLLGVGGRMLYVGLGAGLVLYALRLWVIARRRVAPAEGWAIVAADVLWVVGSAALMGSGLLTAAGAGIVGALAVVILMFAVGQGNAMAGRYRSPQVRSRARPGPGASRETAP